jgi:hypothetical protein
MTPAHYMNVIRKAVFDSSMKVDSQLFELLLVHLPIAARTSQGAGRDNIWYETRELPRAYGSIILHIGELNYRIENL